MNHFQAWLKEQILAADTGAVRAVRAPDFEAYFGYRREAGVFKAVLKHLEDQPLYTEEQIRDGLPSKIALRAGAETLHEKRAVSMQLAPEILEARAEKVILKALDHFTQQPAGVGADTRGDGHGGFSDDSAAEVVSCLSTSAPPVSADSDGSQQPLGGEEVERIARAFHESYEEFAIGFGWKTQEASKRPWEEIPEANRQVMLATVEDLLHRGILTQLPSGGQGGGVEE